MNKILSALLTSTILTATAYSNAGPVAPAAPAAPCPSCPCPVPAFSWGGFKVGVQAGYGNSNNQSTAKIRVAGNPPVLFRISSNRSSNSVVGGLHAIWDYQFATYWLTGLMTSVDFNSFNTKSLTGPNNLFSYRAKSSYTIAAVQRLGITMRDSLVYVGAGWSGSSWKIRTTTLNNTFNRQKTSMISALRLTAGATQRINHFLLGVEVNYDISEANRSKRVDLTTGTRLTGTGYNAKFTPNVFSCMLKASYMFSNATLK